MKRRQFLHTLGRTSLAVAGLSLDNSLKFGFSSASAHTLDSSAFDKKTLVFVYLRGGNDGINTIVPHGYSDTPGSETGYYRPDFRPSIGIVKPNLGNPFSALDLFTHTKEGSSTYQRQEAQGLGMHPSMTGMYELYENGNLAIMPATHYPDSSRSHFSSQQFIESAKADLVTDGWMNRYLVDVGLFDPNSIRGVALSSKLPHMLRGQEFVSAFSDLRNFKLGISNFNNENEVLARLLDVYNQNPDAARQYSSLLHNFGDITLKDLDIVKDLNDGTHSNLDPDTYTTSATTGSDYGDTAFALQMKQTALLIKAGRGLQVASVTRGGFDFHSHQGGAIGNHANLLKDVSDGLKAFFDDLNVDNPSTGASYMDDVLVLVGSEFGRTSYENGSLGVDHAHATSWFALGTAANVKGGMYLGNRNPIETTDPDFNGGIPSTTPITDWIGYDPLANENMLDARYLNHTIDYRNLYGEVLNNFLSTNYVGKTPDLAALLPGFSYSESTKVGFLT